MKKILFQEYVSDKTLLFQLKSRLIIELNIKDVSFGLINRF